MDPGVVGGVIFSLLRGGEVPVTIVDEVKVGLSNGFGVSALGVTWESMGG